MTGVAVKEPQGRSEASPLNEDFWKERATGYPTPQTDRWMIKSWRRSPKVWKFWALEALVNSSGRPRMGLWMKIQVCRGKQGGEISMRGILYEGLDSKGEPPAKARSRNSVPQK